jgi:hypothetical protein
MPVRLLAAALTALFFAGPAQAQTEAPPIPPENSVKLSEIIAKIETRDQFRYVSDVEWDEDGFYRVIYFTSDKAKVEIHIDSATGAPQ